MKLRALFISGCALVVMLVVLDQRPVRLPTNGPTADATVPWNNEGRPVALLLDASGFDSARIPSPADRRDDLEWANLLRQAFGSCDLIELDALRENPELLSSNIRLLVVPRAVLAEASTELLDLLQPFVDSGCDVVLESPDTTLTLPLGLDVATTEQLRFLPWPIEAEGLGCAERLPSLQVKPIELTWHTRRLAPAPSIKKGTRVLANLGGRPAVWEVPSGRGAWILLAPDLADLASRIRQGEAEADGKLRNRHTQIMTGSLQTNDLVTSADLLGADQAWLDAFVEFFAAPELGSTPRPRLSTAPNGHDGWLLVTHDDEMFGDLTRWMTQEEAAEGIPTTNFFLTEPTALTTAGAESILTDSAVIGLHHRWPSKALWQSRNVNPPQLYGFWKIQPFGRYASVAQQKAALEEILPAGESVSFSRSHYLLWDSDIDAPWRQLVAADIAIDSSFGPDYGAAGWLFGSTAPFRPLSKTGKVFDIWEVAFQSAELFGGMTQARLGRWMRTNANSGAGAIHLLFHPDAFAWAPDAELFRYWEAVPELARRFRHKPAHLLEYVGWWEERERLEVQWTWLDGQLEIDVTGPSGAQQGVLIPVRWRDRVLVGWEASWPDTSSRTVERFGRCYRVIHLPSIDAGKSVQVLANYRKI